MQKPELESEIAAAYAAWDSAFNSADASAIANAYTGDAKLLPPTHEVLTGQSAIEGFFAGIISSGVKEHSLAVIDVGGDGDLVVGVATWRAKAAGADQAPAIISGTATHVFERQSSGGLKLRFHTFN